MKLKWWKAANGKCLHTMTEHSTQPVFVPYSGIVIKSHTIDIYIKLQSWKKNCAQPEFLEQMEHIFVFTILNRLWTRRQVPILNWIPRALHKTSERTRAACHGMAVTANISLHGEAVAKQRLAQRLFRQFHFWFWVNRSGRRELR